VYSGLHTQVGLVSTSSLWLTTFGIFGIACLGKGVACWLAARLNGVSASEALGIGTLMNARGMMELILLNIGRERGLITPTLFTILVLMTLGTTLMATPLFSLVYRPAPAPETPVSGAAVRGA
jgi:Kef-type K+ transport system membrane component KefB